VAELAQQQVKETVMNLAESSGPLSTFPMLPNLPRSDLSTSQP